MKGVNVVVVHGLTLNLAKWHHERGLVCSSLTQQHNSMPALHCWAEEKLSDLNSTPANVSYTKEEIEDDGCIRAVGSREDYYDCPLFSCADKSSLLAILPLRTADSLGSCQLLGVSMFPSWGYGATCMASIHLAFKVIMETSHFYFTGIQWVTHTSLSLF